MTGYELTSNWYNFRFENPKLTRAGHSDLYFFIIDKWNRLAQKTEFGLPTDITMECLGIGSYNTYKGLLYDLEVFGFIKITYKAKNQYQSNRIELSINEKTNEKTTFALSKYDEATDKATDEATDKATDEATDKATDKAAFASSYFDEATDEATDKATDSIDKYINNSLLELEREVNFLKNSKNENFEKEKSCGKKEKGFTPPTVEEIQAVAELQAKKLNFNEAWLVEEVAMKFFNIAEGKSWLNNDGLPMKAWASYVKNNTIEAVRKETQKQKNNANTIGTYSKKPTGTQIVERKSNQPTPIVSNDGRFVQNGVVFIAV